MADLTTYALDDGVATITMDSGTVDALFAGHPRTISAALPDAAPVRGSAGPPRRRSSRRSALARAVCDHPVPSSV